MAKENKDGQQKTEQPTSRRKRKSRQEGTVAKSQELNGAMVMITGIVTLVVFGSWIMGRLKEVASGIYMNLDMFTVDPSTIQGYMAIAVVWFFTTLSPIFVSIMIIGIVINVLQFGLLWTTKPLQPKFDKLNPSKALKNLFNQRNAVRLVQNVLKVFFIGYIAYVVLKSEWHKFVPLMDMHVDAIFLTLVRTILKVAIWTLSALLLLAIIDFIYQKWKTTEDLKMSKQEVKDERKMSEGDPKMRAKIRQTQFQLAFNAMIRELPEADVVITNPIHVAVALKYSGGEMQAPIVLGKGLRKLAEKIKKIARENEIPVIENPPLARALYKSCRIGDEIPGQFYQDVAEILAQVYRLEEELTSE
ncbi:flagellar biosynthesis protein FlhB [bacterium]|nr:flagellar biosynthesis protein FlhB [bacterium]